jgi:uncharacterized protein YndB with AHSA1/START domain
MLLVDHTRYPLVISRLAGDAVISYGLREDFFQGQSFIEKIEDTYVVFRKALERLVLNNTCRCNACANISNLDLKFFIYYGTFGIQCISDHDELVGSDINLIHRLLKNSVPEGTGFQAYALYTENAVRQLGVEDLMEGMVPHSESYEHLGEVNALAQDMHPVWEKMRNSKVINFPYDRVMARTETMIQLPRELVWHYLIQPEFRTLLIGPDRIEILNKVSERIGPSSIYQCYHGDKVVPQTILEWQPFERMTTSEVAAILPSLTSMVKYQLESVEGGTKLTKIMSQPTGPFLARMILSLLVPVFSRFGKKTMKRFGLEIEQTANLNTGAQTAQPAVDEANIRDAAAASLRAVEGTDLS